MTEPFHTSDVDLAAFLRCRGLRYISIARNPSNKDLADFVFAASPELFACLHDWGSANGDKHVDAREFGRLRRLFFRNAQAFIKAQS